MKESDKRKSPLYDVTPVLYSLPEVGSTIKVCKREVNSLYERDNRIKSEFTYTVGFNGADLKVLAYTKGIDEPLESSNKCICLYHLGDKDAFTSFPTVQMAIGTVRCFDVRDEEQEREYTAISGKA